MKIDFKRLRQESYQKPTIKKKTRISIFKYVHPEDSYP